MLESIKRFDELLVIEPSKERIIKTALKGFDAIKTNNLEESRKNSNGNVNTRRKIKY